jgi:hypothetical protein
MSRRDITATLGLKPSITGYRGMPHSGNMHITERIRLVAPDYLHDQITIDDPVVLEKPVTYTLAYRRMPDYEMVEFVCDNNRDWPRRFRSVQRRGISPRESGETVSEAAVRSDRHVAAQRRAGQTVPVYTAGSSFFRRAGRRRQGEGPCVEGRSSGHEKVLPAVKLIGYRRITHPSDHGVP